MLDSWRAPWRALLSALVAMCLAAACGGVDSGGTGAPAQSFSSGRIAGFGSVIVNDVRYDDSAAAIVDDDGVLHARADLQLGMVVDIDAGPVSVDAATSNAVAVASRVQFGSAINGPVEAIDNTGLLITVLGQSVRVNAATVFGGLVNGVAGLHVGDLLEVHALYDASSGVYTATRIEPRSAFAQFKLRGVVSRLDTLAKTFFIGSAKISYAAIQAGALPNLANGAIVRVKLQTVQQRGLWLLFNALPTVPPPSDGRAATLEGIVSDFVGLSSFKVDGTPVDASRAGVTFEQGSSGDLADGVRVAVDGTMNGGVLVAQIVKIRQDDADNERVELHGRIRSVDAAHSSFVLRGNTVTYDANTDFDDGNAADLVAGAQVEVRGQLVNHGSQIYASKIEFGR
jgi:hypothetical protein